MTSGVTAEIQRMHDLENILAQLTRAQDHLRVAATRNANRRTMTLDDADIQYEIDQARGCLTQLKKAIASLHPKADPNP